MIVSICHLRCIKRYCIYKSWLQCASQPLALTKITFCSVLKTHHSHKRRSIVSYSAVLWLVASSPTLSIDGVSKVFLYRLLLCLLGGRARPERGARSAGRAPPAMKTATVTKMMAVWLPKWHATELAVAASAAAAHQGRKVSPFSALSSHKSASPRCLPSQKTHRILQMAHQTGNV